MVHVGSFCPRFTAISMGRNNLDADRGEAWPVGYFGNDRYLLLGKFCQPGGA